MGDDLEISDAEHFRASMMANDLHIPQDLMPENDKEGMLRHQDTMDVEDKITAFTSTGSSARTRPAGSPQRTPSVAFGQGEREMILKVLEEVDKTAAKRMSDGFQEINFTLGVLNAFLMAYIFGRYPQHFWILYLVEAFYFIPTKFLYMVRARPLNEAFYYLDLCWCLNFFAVVALVLFVVSSQVDLGVNETFRKEIYAASLGAACGPLAGAAMILPFVAFLFHDVKTMTGLFIHLYPPMVAYTLLWHADEIREAWPTVFRLDYVAELSFFPDSGPFFLPFTKLGSIASNSVALYFTWFVFYSLWQVVIGMDLPRKVRRTKLKDGTTPAPARYDTVFHSTVRGGLCIVLGKVCWGRPKAVSLRQMEENDFELRDLAVYMVAHACAAVLSIYVFAYSCFRSKAFHISLLAFLMIITVHRGAKRYTYYSTTMYGRMIRKQFADQMGKPDEPKKSR